MMSKLIKEKDLISFLKESFYEYDVPKELAENILVDIRNIQGINSNDVIESVNKVNGILLVTADHGNADDESKTSHTLAPVPFIVYNAECELKEGEDLGLSNVAATVCDILGVDTPSEDWNWNESLLEE